MIEEEVPASDPMVKKGMWIYCADKPRGWFLITARWRSSVISGKDVHLAVNGRGPRYFLDFRPGELVRVRTGPED